MLKKEYIRYIRSKFSLVFALLLLVPGFFSFRMSLAEKQLFIEQLETNAEDLNYERLSGLVENMSGLTFLTDFLFTSEYFQLFIVTLFVGVGVFLSVIPQKNNENGWGNLLVERMNYKNYFIKLSLTQSLYIITLLCSVFLIYIIGAFSIGGWSTNFLPIGESQLSFIQMLLFILSHITLIILFTVLVNLFTLAINIYVKNKFLIQSMPLLFFVIIPFVLGSTVANLSSFLGNIISLFIPFMTLNLVYDYLMYDLSLIEVSGQLINIVLLMIITIGVWRTNLKIFSKDYV